MLSRRGFLGAALAAGAAPAFVRTLESRLWVPKGADWAERSAMAQVDLFDAHGRMLQRQFVPYAVGQMEVVNDFMFASTASVAGIFLVQNGDGRTLTFSSGTRNVTAGDTLHVTTKLAVPLGDLS